MIRIFIIVAQGRELVGEEAPRCIRDGVLISFWTYAFECDAKCTWKTADTLNQTLNYTRCSDGHYVWHSISHKIINPTWFISDNEESDERSLNGGALGTGSSALAASGDELFAFDKGAG